MNLRTFNSGSMAGALALVKKELGPSAVILHTRTYRRGGVLGIGAKVVVEVTAGDGVGVLRRPRAAKPQAGYGAPQRSVAPTIPAVSAPRTTNFSEPTAGDLIRRTYAVAKAELGRQQPAVPVAAVAAPPPVVADTSQLAEEMRAVKQMVAQLMRDQRNVVTLPRGTALSKPDAPGKLFDQYLGLLKQHVAEELAEQIVQQVKATLTAAQLDDETIVRRTVQTALAKMIPIDDAAGKLPPTADGRPRTIALIGPTGVGKTTTIAKLAATFKLRNKKNVGLITLDTYRIAAVEQLRTYANIIGLPLHVAMSADELVSAIDKCKGCDVILIDTAGRSQRDDPRLEQLKAFITAANPHEVHLVLSSTCSEPVLVETAERFSQIRADRIIFTKLDEAVSFGVLFNVARRVNKRLSYLTTGQEVPHQIEPGRSERLAGLLMGEGV